MLSSLAGFLVLVMYHGGYLQRLTWILLMYTMGSTAIALITIEESRQYSSVYACALGAATFFTMLRFVGDPVFCATVLFVIGYLADRIVHDCTIVDDSIDSSGQGLVDSGQRFFRKQIERQKQASSQLSDQDASPAAARTNSQSVGKQGHQPGRTVLYLALGALPLFGIGQFFLSSQPDAWQRARWLLSLYLFSSLSLLVVTSFLNLRRYLRQRDTEMPRDVTISWLLGGMVIIAAILAFAYVAPLPGRAIASFQIPEFLKNRSPLEASPWGWGNEAAEEGKPGDAQIETGQQPGAESSQPGQASGSQSQTGAPPGGSQGDRKDGPAGQDSGGKQSGGSESTSNPSNQQSQGSKKSEGGEPGDSGSKSEQQAGKQSGDSSSKSEQSGGQSKGGQSKGGQSKGQQSESNSKQGDASERSSEKSGSPQESGESPKDSQSGEQSPQQSQDAAQSQGKNQSQEGSKSSDDGQQESGDQQGSDGQQNNDGQQDNDGQRGESGQQGDKGQPEQRDDSNSDSESTPQDMSNEESSESDQETQQRDAAKQESENQTEQDQQKNENDQVEPDEQPEQEQVVAEAPPEQPPAQPETSWAESLGALAGLFKFLIFLGLFAIAAFYVYLNREAILAWWNSLFGDDRSDATPEAIGSESPAQAHEPPRPFASYQNPVGDADPRRVVVVTFQALEAWCREQGVERASDETPSEFVKRVIKHFPNLGQSALRVVDAYNRVVYGRSHARAEDVNAASSVWSVLRPTL